MDLLPGFCQGVSRVLVSYPFDYIKTQMQKNKYKTYRELYLMGELSNVYRGVSLCLLTIPIDRSIQFLLFEKASKLGYNPFFSGLCCGAFGSLYNLPLSYISNNYMLLNQKPRVSCFVKETLQHNWSKLFRGFTPEIARSTIASSVYLGVYGSMRSYFGSSQMQTIMNSAIAGISLWTITYPLETLKLEMQTSDMTILRAFTYRVKRFGFFNLWRGILPVYGKTLPSSIVGMLVYEKVKKLTVY